ncbi:hypothetical protein HN592_03645 [Candidatus Woesearchaeota archaeon]|jgi:hypothetical protein|nr:hypothetical protein [Candidatus Woesearchaeota archaeon]MBT4368306.1 hypothetical protein [Candidatus Woesearchaeota archaeon]MBT4712795.1 hypothetical protein [Candidatus Woesearchaeota archaeon]MBT6639707.1 hypothetical protein [Candidatus Woesearchaeota archaeon]MBT7133879.1 hypothetical protein [Candidatus Woesearchaeota archaeon]
MVVTPEEIEQLAAAHSKSTSFEVMGITLAIHRRRGVPDLPARLALKTAVRNEEGEEVFENWGSMVCKPDYRSKPLGRRVAKAFATYQLALIHAYS